MEFINTNTTEQLSWRNKNITVTLAPSIRMDAQPLPHRQGLTSREQETLTYMAAGYTSKMIAEVLYISKKTVDAHRKNIVKKLGVANITAAVALALRKQLIQ